MRCGGWSRDEYSGAQESFKCASRNSRSGNKPSNLRRITACPNNQVLKYAGRAASHRTFHLQSGIAEMSGDLFKLGGAVRQDKPALHAGQPLRQSRMVETDILRRDLPAGKRETAWLIQGSH